MFDDRKDECEYAFAPSDQEIDAMRWLLKTLVMICDHKRPNADKALAVRETLTRMGTHMIALHHRIHELEDVLHSKGYFECEDDDCPHAHEVN